MKEICYKLGRAGLIPSNEGRDSVNAHGENMNRRQLRPLYEWMQDQDNFEEVLDFVLQNMNDNDFHKTFNTILTEFDVKECDCGCIYPAIESKCPACTPDPCEEV